MFGHIINNRYQIETQVGQGGMGIVYKANDLLLDRVVAVKILNTTSHSIFGAEARARLLHEARAAAKLNHQNIVNIFDAGEYPFPGTSEPSPYIVMELIHGKSIYDHKPTGLKQTIDVAKQICAALDHAHTHGIVHRDLKPENIILADDGIVKLTDFGLARLTASQKSIDDGISGTVFYLAPEMATKPQEADSRADLYSLVVILYELVTGSLPFIADDPLAVITQHLYAPVIPPRVHNPEIPPALNELIIQLLSKLPADRPSSANEVERILEIIQTLDRIDSLPLFSSPEILPMTRLARSRLVGRERELAELQKTWQHVITGIGRVFLISGEAGIGKTRLARELMTQVVLSGGNALSGTCDAEGGMPYTPFSQIIHEASRNPQINLDLPDYVVADLITLAPDLRAQFAGISPNPPRDPMFEQQYLFDSVATWCNAISSRVPLLIFIDDAHWADSGSLYLLRHLARRCQKSRLLILVAYREAELDEKSPLNRVLQDLSREKLATRLKLVRLDYDDALNLLNSILVPSGDIDQSIAEAIYHETEGNPFFIEEVTKALLEEDKLQYENERWFASSNSEIQIPQSIRITIQSRLARLPAQTQEILQIAAILGRQFDFDVLMEASNSDEDEIIQALENAERAQIIGEIPHSMAEQAIFSFVHVLIPSTIRENLSTLRRQRLHLRAAEALEKVYQENGFDLGTLAYHYEKAGELERARAYYAKAAEKALAIYANQEAERYYHAALELSGSAGIRTNLLIGLGEALFRQSRYEEAGEAWCEAIDKFKVEGNHDETARLYARLSRATWFAGDTRKGLELCQEGLAVVKEMVASESRPETPGMAALLHETARAYRFNNLSSEALPLCRQALTMAQNLGLVEVQAEALATIGILDPVPDVDKQQALEQAVELAESNQYLSTASRSHLNLGTHLYSRGEGVKAIPHFQRARDLAGQIGNKAMELDFSIALLDAYFLLGNFHEISQELPVLRQKLDALPSPGQRDILLSMFEGLLLFYHGETHRAVDIYIQTLEETRRREQERLSIEVILRLSEALAFLSQLDKAEYYLIGIIQIPEEAMDWDRMKAQSLLHFIYVLQGKYKDAQDIRGMINRTNPTGLRPLPGLLLEWSEAYAAVSAEKWNEAFSHYAHLDESLERMHIPWYRARILEDWADFHLKRDAPADIERAIELLQTSLSIYQQLDLPLLVDQMQAKLKSLS